MTAPPVDPDIDLTTLPWFPVLRGRLFRSTFHLTATDGEWRAGFNLWLRSWDQKPAGSLPDDDHQLRRLAGLAGDRKKWHRVKAMALHGWYLCDDGRLYHATIAEIIKDTIQWTGRGKSGAEAWQKRPRTRREPHLKSTAVFDELKGRDSPPISPPEGDLLKWDGIRPVRLAPEPIDPRMLGHSLPCACPNCTRWAELHKRTATGGD
jgi:uncharacterized protein YdaU (DUF1376 family)